MAAPQNLTNVETVLSDDAYIYSRTDPRGVILEANDAFVEISGFTREELIGKAHNIVRHPDMPKEAFADLWAALKEGLPWRGVVKNRRKDGGYYWVMANVSPMREGNRLIGYQSIRMKPTREEVRAAEGAYKRVKAGDKSLRIFAGNIVLVRNPLLMYFENPRNAFLWCCHWALALSAFGAWAAWQAPMHALLRYAALALCGMCAFTALHVRFLAIPRQMRDIDEINSYLFRVLSSGDLTLPFTYEPLGMPGVIARRIVLMMNWMRSTIRCIENSVVSVERSAEEVSEGVLAIDASASSQNQAASSIAAASAQLGVTIREMAQNLRSTESAVSHSGEQAAQGSAISGRASAKIEELAAAIASASADVEALGRSSAEVGQIAGVIREIADQTNLLALNASIEAARAGEAGRGFAVVASEVRNLADRTMKATANIDELIVKIRQDSERAIAGMEAGAAEVSGGVSLVRDSQQVLNGIDEQMRSTVHRVSEIAVSSSQQTEAMNDIGQNMQQVAAMTEQNVEVVRRTTGLMERLRPMVGRVRIAVAQYKF